MRVRVGVTPPQPHDRAHSLAATIEQVASQSLKQQSPKVASQTQFSHEGTLQPGPPWGAQQSLPGGTVRVGVGGRIGVGVAGGGALQPHTKSQSLAAVVTQLLSHEESHQNESTKHTQPVQKSSVQPPLACAAQQSPGCVIAVGVAVAKRRVGVTVGSATVRGVGLTLGMNMWVGVGVEGFEQVTLHGGG